MSKLEQSNSALASLTATYTDSEGEPDDHDHDEDQDEFESSTIKPYAEESRDVVSAQPSPPTVSVPGSLNPSPSQSQKKALRLVSYNENDDDEPTSPNKDLTVMEIDDEEVPIVPQKLAEEENITETKSHLIDYTKLYGFSLPPEPKGKCPIELQEKIGKSYEKMKTNNLDMNKIIQNRKEFRNPSIYEKLIQFCDINEFGTNYPPEIYDPSHFGKESYYEELARVQKIEMDKVEKAKKEQTTIVVTGSKKPTSDTESQKRKSKWDQPAPNVQVKPVTTVTGTKTTIISAFGSLPKKPKA